MLVFSLVVARRLQQPPKPFRRVPGPKGYPVLGNAHQLSRQPQRELKAWARQYGELFKIQLGWENWVFVNSLEAIKDIFDRQASKTSSRTPMPVACDLISGGLRLVLMPNSPRWKKLRGLVHKLLTPSMSNAFRPSQELEAKQLNYDLLTDNENEENFYMHARRYTASVMMTSTYGKRIPHWVRRTQLWEFGSSVHNDCRTVKKSEKYTPSSASFPKIPHPALSSQISFPRSQASPSVCIGGGTPLSPINATKANFG